MDLTLNPDGGATLGLSHIELVRYYNLLNQALRDWTTWADGTPMPSEVLRPQWVQLRQLAAAVSMPDPGEPDAR